MENDSSWILLSINCNVYYNSCSLLHIISNLLGEKMIASTNKTEKLSLRNKIKRWLGKHFGSEENCNSSCSNCVYCPYVQDSNYTFEIKKRE